MVCTVFNDFPYLSGRIVFLGDRTYSSAPPLPDYLDETGQVILSQDQIKRGQSFFIYAV